MLTGTHNAARKLLDGVMVVADTVGTYSSKPAKMLSDWVADQVAPPYWTPNNQVVVRASWGYPCNLQIKLFPVFMPNISVPSPICLFLLS